MGVWRGRSKQRYIGDVGIGPWFGELLKQGWKPRRTIILCSWDAEEYGLIGSTEWAEELADDLKKAVAYLNLDAARFRRTLRSFVGSFVVETDALGRVT